MIAFPKPKRKPRKQRGQSAKYGNAVTTVCAYGFSHRSKLESAVCQIIWLREKAGELEHLGHECHIYLSDARIGYVADFKCRDKKTGEEFYVEAKGYANDRWPMKKKLYKFYGPGPLEIWTGHHSRPTLDETLTPVRNERRVIGGAIESEPPRTPVPGGKSKNPATGI